jgi:O-methyltransferase domain
MKAVQNGRSAFDQIHGCKAWEFLQRDSEKSAIFNDAMRSLSAVITPAVTASCDWSRFPVIADIAGGIGTQLV